MAASSRLRFTNRVDLSGLGLGAVWAWTYAISRPEIWIKPGALERLAIPFTISCLLSLSLACLAAARFGRQLDASTARPVTLALALLTSIAAAAAQLWLPVPEAQALAFGVLCGIAWALWLVGWAEVSIRQERTVTMARVSWALLFTGLSYLLYHYQLVSVTLYALGLPVVACACFAFSEPALSLRDMGSAAGGEAAQGRHAAAKQLSIPVYAAVIGFVWGSLPTSIIILDPAAWALGCMLCGIVFLLVGQVFRLQPGLDIIMMLAALILCASVLVALVFPEGYAYSPYILVACFEASYLSVLAEASYGSIRHKGRSVSMILQAISAYVGSIAIGVVASLLTADQPGISMAVISLLLLAAIGWAVVNRKALFTEQPVPELPPNGLGFEGQEADSSEAGGVLAGELIEVRCIELAQAAGLTERELEVLTLLAKGHTLASIAAQLYLSENTVKKHRAGIYMKTGIHKRQGIISLVTAADFQQQLRKV